MATILFIKLFPATLIALGFLPSIIWLLLYIREDVHAEPKRLIFRIFLWGMLAAPLAVLAQYLVLAIIDVGHFAAGSIIGLVALAFIEEFLKYLVVRTEIEDEPDFNEATDAMVYMIAAALGFAAVENISIAFSVSPSGPSLNLATETSNLLEVSRVLGIRFLGATLLHAFSSSIIGYAIALRVFGHKKVWIIPIALALATGLHAAFNYLILQSSEVRGISFLISALAMIGAILFMFHRLQKRAITASQPPLTNTP